MKPLLAHSMAFVLVVASHATHAQAQDQGASAARAKPCTAFLDRLSDGRAGIRIYNSDGTKCKEGAPLSIVGFGPGETVSDRMCDFAKAINSRKVDDSWQDLVKVQCIHTGEVLDGSIPYEFVKTVDGKFLKLD